MAPMQHQVVRRSNGKVDGKAMAPIIQKIMTHQGITVAATARLLGVSRASVNGIIHRYTQARKPARTKLADYKKARSPVTVPAKTGKQAQEKSADGYRPNSCQYIEGDILDDAHKCGKPTKDGSAYCEAHHARCYTKGEDRY